MLNYCFIIIKRTGYLHKKRYANKWKVTTMIKMTFLNKNVEKANTFFVG